MCQQNRSIFMWNPNLSVHEIIMIILVYLYSIENIILLIWKKYDRKNSPTNLVTNLKTYLANDPMWASSSIICS